MAPILRLSDDIFWQVFDTFDVWGLVVLSHVCRRWWLLAREHKTFWRAPSIENMTPAEVYFFLAQISQAGTRSRKTEVCVRPARVVGPAQLHAMRDRVLPAVSATLAHITRLWLAVPGELSSSLSDALRQPAPALHTFALTSWNDSGSLLSFPCDVFAGCAPRLLTLIVGEGIRFPDDVVPALCTVERLVFHRGCEDLCEAGLSSPLDSLPRLRQFEIPRGELTRRALCDLATRYTGRFQSLLLHGCSLANIKTDDLPLIEGFVSLLRHLHVVHGVHNYRLLQRLALPQSSKEIYCWLRRDSMATAFHGDSGSLRIRRVDAWRDGYEGPGDKLWAQLKAYPALVSLSIDIDGSWPCLRQDSATTSLPALEVLHITVYSQLPRNAPTGPVFSCPVLRTVVFGTEMYSGVWSGPVECAVLTCRGIDEFLVNSISRVSWASVDVLLVGVRLFGAATVPRTQISGVRIATRDECAASEPRRVATLLRHSRDFDRPSPDRYSYQFM